ncbi:MAG: GntR family transcriptional regulator [Spirochaetota bacterium]|nr:MAG: GntR family transcriptional regulator [Spirochaetota bacterium]
MKTFNYSPVDKNSKIPYYIQIKDVLLSSITNKFLKPGDKLPNEHELAEQFKVSRPTIRQAILDLEIEGLVERIKGRGTFLREKRVDTPLMQTFGIHDEEFSKINVDFTVKVLTRKKIIPTKEIAFILQTEKKEPINYIEKVRISDNKPLVYIICYISDTHCPNFIDEDIENTRSYGLIENKYHIHIAKIKRYLEPANSSYSKKVSRVLKIKENEPFFYLQTYYYDNGNAPIAYFKSYFSYAMSRFTFYFER